MPEWIFIEAVRDVKYKHFLQSQIDEGEASAIALAMETENVLLLLDDLKARKIAAKLKLPFTGTLGIIKKAKDKGVIHQVKPLIEKLLQTDFRIADHILKEFLILCEEFE